MGYGDMKLGFVGIGNWGKVLFKKFTDIGCQIAFVCDKREDRLKKIDQSVPTFSDYKEVIPNLTGENGIEYDGVVIATPAHTHYEVASAFLPLGKPIFVEKPTTMSVSHMDALEKVRKENGNILMGGYIYAYNDFINRIKRMVESNEFGDIRYVTMVRNNFGTIREVEDVVWNLVCHDVSILQYLFSNRDKFGIEVVSSYGRKILGDKVDTVNIIFEVTQDNKFRFPIFILSNWISPIRERHFVLCGSKKTCAFNDLRNELRIYDSKIVPASFNSYGEYLGLMSGDVTIPLIEFKEPLLNECYHFLECIKKNQEPVTGAKFCRDNIFYLEKISEKISSCRS